MALKNSRTITVEGSVFRWKFKAHKDNLTRFGQSPRNAHVVVQAEGKPGKMVAYVESKLDIPDDSEVRWGASHKARFTPGDLKDLILTAQGYGWDLDSEKQFVCPPGFGMTDFKTVEKL